MKPYPLWKTLTLIIVTLMGALYALPNFFGEDPAVQIGTQSGDPMNAEFGARVAQVMAAEKLVPKSSTLDGAKWILHFDDGTTQLKAADVLKRDLGRGYVVALNLAPNTPQWLRAIGARPMALGLDLRGGVHFLLEVDVDDARTKAISAISTTCRRFCANRTSATPVAARRATRCCSSSPKRIAWMPHKRPLPANIPNLR